MFVFSVHFYTSVCRVAFAGHCQEVRLCNSFDSSRHLAFIAFFTFLLPPLAPFLSAGTFFQGTNLEGSVWEDALIGNEDVKRLCENKTLIGESRDQVGVTSWRCGTLEP